MMYSVQKDLELCDKYKINPCMLTFLKLFVIGPTEISEKTIAAEFMKNSSKFCKIMGLYYTKLPKKNTKEYKEYTEKLANLKKNIVIPLVEKNILVGPGDPLNVRVDLDHYEINPKFLKDFELNIYGMPSQLFDIYPRTIRINDSSFLGKNVSAEEIGELYIRNINNCEKKHQEILELIEWGKNNNNIGVGLKKFVEIKYWETLQELKEGGNDGIGFSSELG